MRYLIGGADAVCRFQRSTGSEVTRVALPREADMNANLWSLTFSDRTDSQYVLVAATFGEGAIRRSRATEPVGSTMTRAGQDRAIRMFTGLTRFGNVTL